jgi:general secretion pathway protein I
MKTGDARRTAYEGGFTLMEVLVAGVIMTVSFVMVMQLFSGGLKLSRSSCNYTRAVVHAKDKMEELSGNPVADSGEFEDGFRWESVLEPYVVGDEDADEESLFRLFKITVKVLWDDNNKQHAVKLVSLKLVSADET